MSGLRHLLLSKETKIVYPANATVWEVTIPEGGGSYQFIWVNITYNWSDGAIVDWGDGVVENLTPANGLDKIIPVHTYTQAGVFTIVATGTQTGFQVASANNAYGKYVTAFVQVSDTVVSYDSLLHQCSGLTKLPSTFTIPRVVTQVQNMLRTTSVTELPPGCLLHDGITDCGFFAENAKLTALPAGFTIPDSAAAKCSRVIAGNSQLVGLPDGFSFPETAIGMSQMFFAMSKFDYMPESCHIPAAATDLRSFAASGFTKNVDIGKLFAYWNPQSENINLSSAFEASGVSGIAPADKLWNNPLSATWNVSGCFCRAFNIENLAEIPPTWDGGKVILEDTTIESETEVNALLLKTQVNIASFWGLYGVKVEFNGLPGGVKGAWGSDSNYYLQGTLAAGTYTFTAHAYNKYDTAGATATITLIVDGGGSGSGGGLKVSGVMATMAAMITPAFSFADGNYTLLDATATCNSRVWKLENGGTAFYFRWSETELAWTLAETEEDPAMIGFPYIYSTVNGSDPWSSSGWEFSLTGPVSIEVTQA